MGGRKIIFSIRERRNRSVDRCPGRLAQVKLGGMARELTLRIVVEGPPPGVDYALQKGSGSAYDTEQKQRSAGKDLVFEFQVGIRDAEPDAMAALRGPYVQGPRGNRFVYIDIGTYAGQADSCWSRRLSSRSWRSRTSRHGT